MHMHAKMMTCVFVELRYGANEEDSETHGVVLCSGDMCICIYECMLWGGGILWNWTSLC